MNRLWVRIRSWHALRIDERGARTLCGRIPATEAEVVDLLPGGRSCESCLRILARAVDR